jgi:hypothetical protein
VAVRPLKLLSGAGRTSPDMSSLVRNSTALSGLCTCPDATSVWGEKHWLPRTATAIYATAPNGVDAATSAIVFERPGAPSITDRFGAPRLCDATRDRQRGHRTIGLKANARPRRWPSGLCSKA